MKKFPNYLPILFRNSNYFIYEEVGEKIMIQFEGDSQLIIRQNNWHTIKKGMKFFLIGILLSAVLYSGVTVFSFSIILLVIAPILFFGTVVLIYFFKTNNNNLWVFDQEIRTINFSNDQVFFFDEITELKYHATEYHGCYADYRIVYELLIFREDNLKALLLESDIWLEIKDAGRILSRHIGVELTHPKFKSKT